ncbi:cobyrinate a,c-diamide synthase [Desulfonauticus submarinus]
MSKSFMLAGLSSGSGKTSLSLALISALSQKGYEIFPFKVGPDYLDPMYLSKVAQKPCLNLDLFFSPLAHIKSLLNTKGINLIEGVMGYYDGDKTGKNSCADLALALDIPVFLVVNPLKLAQTFGAIIYGLINFKPAGKQIKGIILNNYSSEKQKEIFANILKQANLPPLIGAVPKGKLPELKSRHLGLKSEGSFSKTELKQFSQNGEKYINLDYILSSLKNSTKTTSMVQKTKPIQSKPKLMIIKDKAFNFYYQANLNALQRAGVELVFASSFDQNISFKNINGLYIGGGYPELYAKELSQNQNLIIKLKDFIQHGGKVYAECGGLVFLSNGLILKQKKYPFLEILPFWVKMQPKRVKLGYVQVKVVQDAGWFKQDSVLKGHEFHYSEIIEPIPKNLNNVYTVFDSAGNKQNTFGIKIKNVLASYVHLYFAHDYKVITDMINFLKH